MKRTKEDIQIAALMQAQLPKAGNNPWFVPRLMHRLPPRSARCPVAWPSVVCYCLAALSFVGLLIYVLLFGSLLTLLATAVVLPLVALAVIAYFAAPALHRALYC